MNNKPTDGSDTNELEQLRTILWDLAANAIFPPTNGDIIDTAFNKINQLIATKEAEAYERGYADKSIWVENRLKEIIK
jgi:hypothetical protein